MIPGLSATSIAFLSFVSVASVKTPAQQSYPDTLWVPVIFYDYHPNGLADFQRCLGTVTMATTGMVQNNLDAQRKPIPASIACPSNPSSTPCACHLPEWFRVSGQSGSDQTTLFLQDTTNPKRPLWHWTNLLPYLNRVGEYTGPNYNSTYSMANIVIIDSLPFIHLGRNNPALVGNYEYLNDAFFKLDGRGYGNEPSGYTHNYGFTMELHTVFQYKKGLQFNFMGDDDVWAFVNGQLMMDLGGVHSSLNASFNLDNMPGLVEGQTYPFDLFYAERHTTSSTIRINSNIISAFGRDHILKVIPGDTICAGDTVTIIGSLYDTDGKVMPVLSDSIRWTLVPADLRPADRLIYSQNDSTKFTGQVAYRRIGIIGSYRDNFFNIRDTTYITINPGTPSQVDIILQNTAPLSATQATSVVNDTIITPRLSIYLDSALTRMYAYAVLRDRFGNYIRLADQASWTSLNTDTATATGTVNKLFEGVVNRVAGARSGTTYLVASSIGMAPDSARIVLRSDQLVALRLVDNSNPALSLDTIRMNTDQSIALKVQGRWSTNPTTWADVTGTWSMTPLIQSTIPLPTTEAGSWQFDPTKPGTAMLTVVSGNQRANAAVIITAAPPTSLTLTLVTNPDSCFAGRPIKIAARIENRDGPVLGNFVGTSLYQDILNNTLRSILPWMRVNGRSTPDSLGKSLAELFTNGNDTISLVLYYAPLSADSLHQIQLTLSGGGMLSSLSAKNIPFRLKPGPLDSVQIEDQFQRHLNQEIVLTSPTGLATLYARGFDQYGNKILSNSYNGEPLLLSTWRVDGSLHRIPADSIGQIIYYFADSTIIYNESGNMSVTLVVQGKTLKDVVPIRVVTAGARLESATTRDINGNGLIDRFDLVFDKSVTLATSAIGSINFTSGATVFTPDSIVKLTGSSYALCVTEQRTRSSSGEPIPQTAWRPNVCINNLPGVLNADNLPALDGCPPVLWNADCTIAGPDSVRVCFSEKVMGIDGGTFNPQNQPAVTFSVWTFDGSAYVKVDTLLIGIESFLNIVQDSIFLFVMTNDRKITEAYYLNIRTPSPIVKDLTGNLPTAENQKIRIIKSAQGVIPRGFAITSYNAGGSAKVLCYALPQRSFVRVSYFDLRGRLAGSFINSWQEPGYYSFPVPVSSRAKGAYFQVFEAGKFVKKEIIVQVR